MEGASRAVTMMTPVYLSIALLLNAAWVWSALVITTPWGQISGIDVTSPGWGGGGLQRLPGHPLRSATPRGEEVRQTAAPPGPGGRTGVQRLHSGVHMSTAWGPGHRLHERGLSDPQRWCAGQSLWSASPTLSVRPSARLSVSVCLPLSPSVCLSVSLSVCLARSLVLRCASVVGTTLKSSY